jgi:hypothetical protein
LARALSATLRAVRVREILATESPMKRITEGNETGALIQARSAPAGQP